MVLIPLLVDDPLWALSDGTNVVYEVVLIPLLVDDPLWENVFYLCNNELIVLIPLLVDDPLWGVFCFSGMGANEWS